MRILVAASGSPDGSHDPVAAVSSLPWPEGSEIRVLTVSEVVDPTTLGVVPPILDMPEVQVAADNSAIATATEIAAKLRQSGLRVEGIAVEGDPKTAIVDHARKWGADVIVVGFHDRSRVERMLLGSVCESVVQHSPCSVLVVKTT